jgi:hypothetical protein
MRGFDILPVVKLHDYTLSAGLDSLLTSFNRSHPSWHDVVFCNVRRTRRVTLTTDSVCSFYGKKHPNQGYETREIAIVSAP